MLLIKSKRYLSLLILITLTVLLTFVSAPHAQENLDVNILAQPEMTGPVDVSFEAYITNGDQPVLDINPTNLTFNNDQATNVSLVPVDGALSLVILVDMGQGNSLTLHQNTLNAFFTNELYFRDGDTVTLLVQNGRDLISEPQTANTVDGALGLVNTLGVVNEANGSENSVGLSQALNIAANAERPTSVLYLSAIIFNTNDIQATMQSYRNQGVRLHVVRNHFNRAENEIIEIGQSTGGAFVNNNEGSLVQNGVIAIGALSELFTIINQNRIYYQVSYTSSDVGISQRNVEFVVTDNNGNVGRAEYSYVPQLVPPSVEIIAPTQFSPVRTYNVDGVLNNLNTPVYIRVTFFDGVPREISELRLEFQDVNGNERQSSIIVANPVIDANNVFQVDWDLRDYSEPASTTSVTLIATVIDELGLIGSISNNTSISVSAIPTVIPIVLPDEPFVAVIEPQPLDITRRYRGLESNELDNSIVNLRIAYMLPMQEDDTENIVSTVEMYVRRAGSDVPAQETIIIQNPEILANDQIQIPWDISVYNTEDTVNDLTIEIVVIGIDGQLMTTERLPASVSVSTRTLENFFLCSWFRIAPENCPFRRYGDEILFGLQSVLIIAGFGSAYYFRFTQKGQEQFEQIRESATNAVTNIYEGVTNIYGNKDDEPDDEHFYACLDIIDQWDRGIKQILITKEEFTIGRSLQQGADYVINKPDISRRHCNIRLEDNEFIIQDLRSSGKTYLNGEILKPLRDYTVTSGDEIRLFTYRMIFKLPEESYNDNMIHDDDTNLFPNDDTNVQDAANQPPFHDKGHTDDRPVSFTQEYGESELDINAEFENEYDNDEDYIPSSSFPALQEDDDEDEYYHEDHDDIITKLDDSEFDPDDQDEIDF